MPRTHGTTTASIPMTGSAVPSPSCGRPGRLSRRATLRPPTPVNPWPGNGWRHRLAGWAADPTASSRNCGAANAGAGEGRGTWAGGRGRGPNRELKAWRRGKYVQHAPRASRYWELVAIMRGEPPTASPNAEWAWIVAAMKHHLAD